MKLILIKKKNINKNVQKLQIQCYKYYYNYLNFLYNAEFKNNKYHKKLIKYLIQ